MIFLATKSAIKWELKRERDDIWMRQYINIKLFRPYTLVFFGVLSRTFYILCVWTEKILSNTQIYLRMTIKTTVVNEEERYGEHYTTMGMAGWMLDWDTKYVDVY